MPTSPSDQLGDKWRGIGTIQSATSVLLVRWQENLTLRPWDVDHHSPSPPGHIPQHTSIPTTSTPTTSTLINAHQHIHDAPKYSPFCLLYALMADALYCGGSTNRPQSIKAGGLGTRRLITKVESWIHYSGDWFASI